jgi:FkbM family methyltransferase
LNINYLTSSIKYKILPILLIENNMIALLILFSFISIFTICNSLILINENLLIENITISTCQSNDLLKVGPVHKYNVCVRKDDPIIEKFVRRDSYWGFMLEYEVLLAHKGPYFVIEIGGNIGLNAIHAAVLGHEVLAFEPQKDLASYIKLNALLNGVLDNVTVIRMGVSDAKGTATFSVNSRNRGGSEIIEGSISNHHSKRNSGGIISIDLISLDEIQIKNKVFLMKIDVESHELKVLLGGKIFFSSIYKPDIILLEFGYVKQKPHQILEFLSNYQYEV